jgi:hypothetical protein
MQPAGKFAARITSKRAGNKEYYQSCIGIRLDEKDDHRRGTEITQRFTEFFSVRL